jgi:hypothetical protein
VLIEQAGTSESLAEQLVGLVGDSQVFDDAQIKLTHRSPWSGASALAARHGRCQSVSKRAIRLGCTGYRRGMTGVVAGLWGLFGGFAVEGLEFYAVWQRYRRWPWRALSSDDIDSAGGTPPAHQEAGAWGYAVAEVIRLLIGAGLAWAAAATGQISGPLGALGVGAAAPTIIGQLVRTIPLELPAPTLPGAAPLSVNGRARTRPVVSVRRPAPAAQPDPAMATEGED